MTTQKAHAVNNSARPDLVASGPRSEPFDLVLADAQVTERAVSRRANNPWYRTIFR
jgi:hypothetical protein